MNADETTDDDMNAGETAEDDDMNAGDTAST